MLAFSSFFVLLSPTPWGVGQFSILVCSDLSLRIAPAASFLRFACFVWSVVCFFVVHPKIAISSSSVAPFSAAITAVLTLAQHQFLPGVYEADSINLSSLGSGGSMKWEIDTVNKNVAVSGVVMQWS
ncbi:hypothetical protein [Neorhizobium galegae]|uniref:hypothetical protein n=1 Tax=Neorhizobium galegae TaxID=399 RepID=UPI001F28A1E9|nr:hypothetical protein [Neorhizobium galegae]UIK07965.1 hypothetical protein LZK81_26470 [Neorhizobium galegae]